TAEARIASQKLKELMTATVAEEVIPTALAATSAAAELNRMAGSVLSKAPDEQPVSSTRSSTTKEISTKIPVTYRINFSCQDLSEAVMTKLLTNLARQGSLENLNNPQQQDSCCLKLTTMESEEDIWETLAFIVD